MEGPEQQFDRFYGENFVAIGIQLYAHFGGDRTEAQDLVQEAFARAWQRWATVSTYDDPAAWVRQVAWRLAISRWRRARTALAFRGRQREEYAPPPSPNRVALDDALKTLPPAQRRAVIQHYLTDLSVRDIAEQEGVAEGTVKSWLHRARAALADRLDDRTPRPEVPSHG